ncbi:MAG: two component transcriptional regulator, winged helix family [Chloroflexi bacterium OLB14]|nr:MAG: two component transcriptional regulator, winged helix family [Chloroflexi bacterium OLB14]
MAKIVIVDDDEKVTTLLGRFLASAKHQVTTLNDSSKALTAIHTTCPDLIILDIMMPYPDGFTLCRMIRDEPKFAQTPILIITALDNSNSKATTFGANDYLAKPFNLDELSYKIDALIKKEK